MAERDDSQSWTAHDDASLRHAWDWFSLHANQRLQMYNFFSVTTAFLVAAFVTAHGDGSHDLAAAVALVGATTSSAFNLLERRTRALVHAAEAALAPLEARLGQETGNPAMEIVNAVERPGHRLTKYSFVFNGIQLAAAAGWAACMLVELLRYR